MNKIQLILYTIWMNRGLLKDFLLRGLVILPAAALYTVLTASMLSIAPESIAIWLIFTVFIIALDYIIDWIKKL